MLRLPARAALRSAAPLRRYCAPAVAAKSPLVMDMEEKLAAVKEMMKSAESPYPVAKFEADVAAGTVDRTLLADALSFDDELKKDALSKLGAIQKGSMDLASDYSIDWDALEAKVSDKAYIGKLKKLYTDTKAEIDGNLPKFSEEISKGFAATKADMKKFSETAMKESKERTEAAIVEMELLVKQAEGIKTMTVADILEAEPELRAELEAEIENHDWHPGSNH